MSVLSKWKKKQMNLNKVLTELDATVDWILSERLIGFCRSALQGTLKYFKDTLILHCPHFCFLHIKLRPIKQRL